jgi:N utilization substance protein A
MIYEEFTSKEHEILTGVVSRIDPRNGNVYIKLTSSSEMTEAVLMAGERVRSELINEGDRIKVYVIEVRRPLKGPQVVVSRTHTVLLKRLFELEVPKFYDHGFEIKSIAVNRNSKQKLPSCPTTPRSTLRRPARAKGTRVANIVDN